MDQYTDHVKHKYFEERVEDMYATYEHGPRFTTNQEKNAPVWWGVNVFTSNIATGWGPVVYPTMREWLWLEEI